MKQFILFIMLSTGVHFATAQNWLTTGNTASASDFLGTINAADLTFKTNNLERGRLLRAGVWRFGSATNFAKIDSAGKLTFGGAGTYLVAGNNYVFQYSSAPNYGLFFNSTDVRYEFRDGSASSIFSINANTGNTAIRGMLTVGAYTFPATDGTSEQVLKTNGAGVLTWSVDNNTVYSAGTGIDVTGTTITNTAPDQTVALNPGSGINITGSYPNFTITNTLPAGWGLTGNAGTTSANFIGTTDAQPLIFKVSNQKAGNLDFDAAKANTSFGYKSLNSNTGNTNSAFGYQSLLSNTSGSKNTANGSEALYSNTIGSYNTAIGFRALYLNTSGSYNLAAGYWALYSNRTGNYNTASGNNALYYNTTGNYSTAVGQAALYNNNSGSGNTAVGYNALLKNTSGYNNVAMGDSAGRSNTTASNNTFIGSFSGLGNTTGYDNAFVGMSAGYANTKGYYNCFIGRNAGYANIGGFGNAFMGAYAGRANTTGIGNSFFGRQAGYSNTTGNSNVCVGPYSGYSNITGSENVFIGSQAGYYSTATGNVMLGYQAGYFNTGASNCFTGYQAAYNNTSGNYNTADGYKSLYSNTTGSNNTSIGDSALYSNTTGVENTAIGNHALFTNTVGSNNTASGNRALNYNTTGFWNIAIGEGALYNNTDGIDNTVNGHNALYYNSTGSSNTAIGSYAGGYNDMNSYCTFVGHDADQAVTTDFTNSTALGHGSRITASNQVRIGNSTVSSVGGYQNWTNISDGRYKKNVKEDVRGLDFINKLKPVTYNLDISGIRKFLSEDIMSDEGKEGFMEKTAADKTLIEKGVEGKERIVYSGFIAQDVEQAAKEVGYDFSGVDKPEDENGLYGLRYAEFVVPLVKAVQELSGQNEKLKSQNEEQREINYAQQKQIDELKSIVHSLQENFEKCIPCAADALSQQSSKIISVSGASLEQNIPNPFNHTTTIYYTLPEKYLSAKIIVVDKAGKVLKEINLPAGRQGVSGNSKGSLKIDVTTLASGAYQYSLYLDGRLIDTKQMEHIK